MAKMSDKWPKSTLCEIRAAWSGVFSIPGGTTGPGFKAEIRPPLKWHFFDTFFAFSWFTFCAFSCFWHFCEVDKLIIFWEVTFFNIAYCNVIRPYCNHSGEDENYVWWFSPHASFIFVYWRCSSFHVGEIIGEEKLLLLSFSPLWTGWFLSLGNTLFIQMSGRFTG